MRLLVKADVAAERLEQQGKEWKEKVLSFLRKYFKKGVDGVNQSCRMRLLVKANGSAKWLKGKGIVGLILSLLKAFEIKCLTLKSKSSYNSRLAQQELVPTGLRFKRCYLTIRD